MAPACAGVVVDVIRDALARAAGYVAAARAVAVHVVAAHVDEAVVVCHVLAAGHEHPAHDFGSERRVRIRDGMGAGRSVQLVLHRPIRNRSSRRPPPHSKKETRSPKRSEFYDTRTVTLLNG